MAKGEEVKKDERNLYQRMMAVMADVGYVQKDTKVEAGKGSYKAVSHDHVIGMLRPALLKHGVYVSADVVEDGVIADWVHQKYKTRWTQTRAKMAVTFVNVDDPSQSLTVHSVGYGNDNSDKGIGKAVSYAVKYALLKCLSLETGEDADSIHEPLDAPPMGAEVDDQLKKGNPKYKPATPAEPTKQANAGPTFAQVAEKLRGEYIDACGSDEAFMALLGIYGCEKVEELTKRKDQVAIYDAWTSELKELKNAKS